MLSGMHHPGCPVCEDVGDDCDLDLCDEHASYIWTGDAWLPAEMDLYRCCEMHVSGIGSCGAPLGLDECDAEEHLRRVHRWSDPQIELYAAALALLRREGRATVERWAAVWRMAAELRLEAMRTTEEVRA